MFRPLLLAACLAAAVPARAEAPEPKVQRIVVEDDGARIEELRVRGQTRRIVVTPKNSPLRSYEIIPGDSARDPTQGRGSAGQRVWNVLTF